MEEQNILNRLKKIESIVIEIQRNMIDPDSIMTEEDYEDLLNYRKEKKTGKLISHQTVKKEFGL